MLPALGHFFDGDGIEEGHLGAEFLATSATPCRERPSPAGIRRDRLQACQPRYRASGPKRCDGARLREIATVLTEAGDRTKRGARWHPQTIARCPRTSPRSAGPRRTSNASRLPLRLTAEPTYEATHTRDDTASRASRSGTFSVFTSSEPSLTQTCR